MNLFNRFLAFANIGLLILTLGAYLAPYFHPNYSAILALLGLVYPALLMANVCFILYWFVFKPQWAVGSIVIVLLGFNSVFHLVGLSQVEEMEVNTPTLNVASFNMQFAKPIRVGSKANRATLSEQYKAYLRQFQEIDILCLQEHSQFAQDYVKATLHLPHKYASKGNYVAIYSKYPIINKGSIKRFSNNAAMSCIWSDVVIGKDTIRVYATHLEANQKDGVVPKKIVETAKEPPVSSSMALGLLQHYQTFSSKRVAQAKRINAHRKNSPYPSILCGDMNDTPQSYLYSVLSDQQKDAFREKGQGFGATFGSTFKNKLASLRIDYIFADPVFEILDHHIFPDDFSDHYLIQSEIQL